MQQQNIPIHTLVDMYKRGELRLQCLEQSALSDAIRFRTLDANPCALRESVSETRHLPRPRLPQ